MKIHEFKIILIAILLFQIANSQEEPFYKPRFHKEIPRKNEKELKIKISGGAGVFYILPGSNDKIVVIDGYSRIPEKSLVDIKYSVDEDIGYLDFELTSGTSIKRTDDAKWYIKLCKDIPTTLDIELGASKADIELGGLSLKNLKISTGVSSTNLKFTSPNKITMRKFEIEAGVAKFDGEKLGNARFKNLKVSGGMGSFDIDLSGELLDDADVNFEIGFGNLDVYLPKDVGAIITPSSSFFTSKKFDNFYKRGDKFISFNYDDAQKKINIFIESGLGNIRVRWTE
ncbi:N-terminal domain of toast_rack, DUF2154 [Candidatus Kryptonium thompsonii]|uniref:N-terminal domain of toast_rack, DUF2154 n=2 Tax=Candidatus Kryptonium thompsonii TaxID=1633631 RepID=A0A0N7MQM3_9BACT|nr:LiaF domain-containing protein [Candidatus Kryptonium thompsoni]CUS80263.1 N-terminal domain of toast_rack, DUF2154 [Candidatus Kryptonium thompsoni]CUS82243.1 N-terminal domain of toast_rack, DUF2154 [Candidatus Kryptonium thompsoni]CUS84834.1 N-terminal domain of toast_rack, DUF2154 [Candidatus Kryptonium thompsoni]CUS86654.1 N-terminal domain of toast_rack, DUF2154 [Candidatus Kryptonium thompsoni]CUS87892.1 N-terminal domain of toast_rack, DUF2154 [Candidatus Kryptonium thompsoni]